MHLASVLLIRDMYKRALVTTFFLYIFQLLSSSPTVYDHHSCFPTMVCCVVLCDCFKFIYFYLNLCR